jgi:acyl-CoA thioester hydrolase
VTGSDRYPGRRPEFTPCFWGSVNQWECDENDHLNVRFYAHKINQAIRIFASATEAGVSPAQRIRAQHIRFLKESRVATPLRIDCGCVRHDGGTLEVLALMHHNVTGEVLATFVTTLEIPALPAPAGESVEVPDFARPRGIPAELPALPRSRETAFEMGYQVVGRGVVGRDECDESGVALPHVYIGRISDGMPNLWAIMNAEEDRAAREQGALGGAALEQRLEILEPLRSGSIFTHLSGVRALGSKTQQMSHLLYNEDGRLAARAEAVGVAMDLTTRKAVPISEQRRERLEPLLLR